MYAILDLIIYGKSGKRQARLKNLLLLLKFQKFLILYGARPNEYPAGIYLF